MNSNILAVGSVKVTSVPNKANKDIKGVEQTFFNFMNPSNSFAELGNTTNRPKEESVHSAKSDYTSNVYNNTINTKIKTVNNNSKEVEIKLEDAIEDVKEVLMDKFQVTEEELQEVLEMLGMQYTDLLNMDGFQEIVTTLLGETQSLELLLNPTFQEAFLSVNQIHTQLLKDLGITAEELNLLCEGTIGETVNALLETSFSAAVDENADFEMINNQDSTTDTAKDMVKDAVPIEDSLDQSNGKQATNSVLEEKMLVETIEVVPKEVVEEVSEEVSEGKKAELATKDSSLETDFKTKTTTTLEEAIDKMQNSSQSKSEDMSGQSNLFAKNAPNNMQMNNVSSAGFSGELSSMVDVKSILDQIMNSVKLHITPEITSMEMQLNPAHLGRMSLQVSAREGIVTAQMAVETQAAKEAIESQIVVLKEQMNQQGIKVEAVEVTIASHEFERNLEGNASGQQQQAEQAKENQSRRNLQLNQLDGMEDDLTAEEKLVAQIMTDNGNSVDMTA